ncbi:hypothetical protein C8Q80DRAFT_642064 [Daedaleopsis nitida]|nr:hypothetical protein C8Q80DRAFT_642064 [Daedaleopsis nitida]
MMAARLCARSFDGGGGKQATRTRTSSVPRREPIALQQLHNRWPTMPYFQAHTQSPTGTRFLPSAGRAYGCVWMETGERTPEPGFESLAYTQVPNHSIPARHGHAPDEHEFEFCSSRHSHAYIHTTMLRRTTATGRGHARTAHASPAGPLGKLPTVRTQTRHAPRREARPVFPSAVEKQRARYRAFEHKDKHGKEKKGGRQLPRPLPSRERRA